MVDVDDTPEWMQVLSNDGEAASFEPTLAKASLGRVKTEVKAPEEVADENDAEDLLLALKDRLAENGDSARYHEFLASISASPVEYQNASAIVADYPDLLESFRNCFGTGSAGVAAPATPPRSVPAAGKNSASRITQLVQLIFANKQGHEGFRTRVQQYASKQAERPAFPRRLYILRGPHGCGKAEWAQNSLLDKVPTATSDLSVARMTHVCSADDFCKQFTSEKSDALKLITDPSAVTAHHIQNEARVRLAMEVGIEPLYVDTCNMTLWEMRPYVKLADRMGYVVTVVAPQEIHACWSDVETLMSRNAERCISRAAVEKMVQAYEDVAAGEDICASIRAAERPYTEDDEMSIEVVQQKTLLSPAAILYKFEQLLKEGVDLKKVPGTGKSWGVTGEFIGEWHSFRELPDGSCTYDDGNLQWYTGDPENAWSFADIAMLDELKKQTAQLPAASVPSATSHPALFGGDSSSSSLAAPVEAKSQQMDHSDEEEEKVPMSRKERFKQRVMMKVKMEEETRAASKASKVSGKVGSEKIKTAVQAPLPKPGVPTSQEETSAATFLAAVKSRLIEWGKPEQYHEFVLALSGTVDAKAAVRILRGHDDLLSVFKSKFAPQSDLIKIKAELEFEGPADSSAAPVGTLPMKVKSELGKRPAPRTPAAPQKAGGPRAPTGPPPRRVKGEQGLPVKSEISKSVKGELRAKAEGEDAPRPPMYDPRIQRGTVTIGDDSDEELPDPRSIAVAARKGRDACIAELAKIVFFKERASHQGARVRLDMVRYATKVAACPRFPREVFILRGCPGAGKTQYAIEQLSQNHGYDSSQALAARLTHICAVDDFFEKYGPNGPEYKFQVQKLEAHHARNEARVQLAMEAGIHPLYVDCPNLKLWEMQPFVKLADDLGYVVNIVEPNDVCDRWDDLDFLVAASDTPERRGVGKIVSRGTIAPLLNTYEPMPMDQDPLAVVRSAGRPADDVRAVEATPMPPETGSVHRAKRPPSGGNSQQPQAKKPRTLPWMKVKAETAR